MEKQTNITCPSCAHKFQAEEALAIQLRGDIQKELESDFQEKHELLKELEENLKAAQESQTKEIAVKLQEREAQLRPQLEREAEEKQSLLLRDLREQNATQKEELKSLQEKELELRKRERELKEAAEQNELTVARTLADEREIMKSQLQEQAEAKSQVKLEERDLLIRQLTAKVDDMKRKTEQGSMQVQGEAQELVIEQHLRERFPFDLIEEVGKGVRGADCVQRVRDERGQLIGSIVYESKRTKTWSDQWLGKLKEDTRQVKGNLSVIVTETLPKDMKGIEQIDGVWVCNFSLLPFLSSMLRYALLRESKVLASQENKGDKMHQLYDYLIGDEFTMQMKGIVDGFTAVSVRGSTSCRSKKFGLFKSEALVRN